MKKDKVNRHQKPIEHDIHLKYICQKCGMPHWLSFKEASTKNFKVVCDCGYIFGVKRVSDIKIKYKKPILTKTSPIQANHKCEETKPTIPIDLLDKTTDILISYGFTLSEAKDLITNSYSNNPNNNITSLVKQVLESLKGKNVI